MMSAAYHHSAVRGKADLLARVTRIDLSQTQVADLNDSDSTRISNGSCNNLNKSLNHAMQHVISIRLIRVAL